MTDRIKQLEQEIRQFQEEREKRRRSVTQLQQELIEIHEGILTRQGGLVELKKIEAEK